MRSKDKLRLKQALEKMKDEKEPVMTLDIADEHFTLTPEDLLAASQYIAVWFVDKA